MTPTWLTSRRALVGLAAVSLLGAVVAALPGWLVPGFVLAMASSSVASSTLVVVAAVLAGLYGLRVLTADDGDAAPRRPAVRFPATPPEVAVHEVRRVVGEDVDAAASSEEAEEQWRRRRHRRRAHETLRAAAADAVAEATGCDRAAANRLVAEGRWTDRVRARAYLAADDSVRPPLRTRVRDWAAGERTERAVRDTVAAILAIRDGDDAVARAEVRADEAAAAADAASDAADFRLTGAEHSSSAPDAGGTADESEDGAEAGESDRPAAVAEADGGRHADSGGERR